MPFAFSHSPSRTSQQHCCPLLLLPAAAAAARLLLQVKHALHALQASLPDGELTAANCSVAVVGRGMPFTLLEDEALEPYITGAVRCGERHARLSIVALLRLMLSTCASIPSQHDSTPLPLLLPLLLQP